MSRGEPEGPVPENAPEQCPGTESENAGTAAACQGCPNQSVCATTPSEPDADLIAIERRLSSVKHKILVLSGKGGVGKSTFATQLAFALAQRKKYVGLLDIDICGPSLPRMLGLEGEEIHQSGTGWSPVYVEENLGVMSIGFMLPNKDDAVIWRGPRKNSLIKQFLKDVDWGDIDYLVVDAPPGTSDEHISIAQYLKSTSIDGAVIVTTPQEVALIDVRKEINFCKKVGIPILGVVENMSGLQQSLSSCKFTFLDNDGAEKDLTTQIFNFVRQHCGDQEVRVETEVFFSDTGGAAAMAAEMGVSFIGRIPLDPVLSRAAEEGKSILGQNAFSQTAFNTIVQKLMRSCQDEGPELSALSKDLRGNGDPVQHRKLTGDVPIDPLLSSRIHLGF